MANLTETSTWEAGVYQLERVDQWDAGTGGNGLANLQGSQLANRTKYLKTEIEKRWNRQHSQVAFADNNVPSNTVEYSKGTAWSLLFPLGDQDYTTPNDAITRDYIITIGCTVGSNFSFDAAKTVQMCAVTSTTGPVLVELVRAITFQPGVTMFAEKKVTLGPNVKVACFYNVSNYGVSVDLTNAFFRIEEVIKA